MEFLKIKDINKYKSQSVDPSKSPGQIFEVYSVPSFDTKTPEYLTGAEIGSSKVVVQKNDVLLCKINPRINRVWTVGNPCEYPSIASSEWIIVRTDEMNPHYLAWYFRSPRFKTLMISEVTGIGGSLTRAQPKRVAEYPLPMISLDEQEFVVQTFDTLQGIIESRKQQLAELDNLVKAQFVEMFGEPMSNSLKWDKVNISAVAGGKVSNGFFAKRDDYCNDGNIRVLGVANVVNRMYSQIQDLPRTNGTDSDVAKYGVRYGDMLFCRSSLVTEGIGKASVVPKGTPDNVLFECHVIRLPLDLKKCVPEFMQALSTTDYFRNQVIAQSKTATMTTIGQDGILKTEIILPPLALQKQFLQFVEQVDKSKFAYSMGGNLSDFALQCTWKSILRRTTT